MIEFVAVDETNFEAVISLEVNENQSKYVAPNVRSLAECYLYRKNEDVFPYVIQHEGIVIGFLLLDYDPEVNEMMIWRMMIDKEHQGQGYGKETVKRVIEMAEADPGYTLLIADYVKGNEVMGRLLRNLGFKDHSYDKDNNEFVLHYAL